MGYLLLGCAALTILVLIGRGRPVLRRPEWRLGAGALAVAALAAAAFIGLRGAWGSAIVLAVAGVWLASSVRTPRVSPPPRPERGMSLAEARSILGVEEGADEAEIKAAYARLMRRAHPDVGGSAGLAAQLNAARDRLLGRPR